MTKQKLALHRIAPPALLLPAPTAGAHCRIQPARPEKLHPKLFRRWTKPISSSLPGSGASLIFLAGKSNQPWCETTSRLNASSRPATGTRCRAEECSSLQLPRPQQRRCCCQLPQGGSADCDVSLLPSSLSILSPAAHVITRYVLTHTFAAAAACSVIVQAGCSGCFAKYTATTTKHTPQLYAKNNSLVWRMLSFYCSGFSTMDSSL